MNNIFLSKSSYCKCVQCNKILWLKNYKPEEAIQKASDTLFENGRKVGILAQDIFGEKHEDIEYSKNYTAMVEKTRKLLENKPNIITEATFNYDNNFCMVDILKNDEDGVEIYEVKSSTKVSDIYLDDASFQYFVLSNLGLNVKKVSIVYINNKYVRGKELELDKLFNVKDITDIARKKQDEIRNKVDEINSFMARHDKDNQPDTPMGNQCLNPYKCDFWEYCNKMENNTLSTDDDEPDFSPIINKEAIKQILDSLKYPLYFIDYETYTTPIPEIEGTRPYQQLPFQYSLHIKKDREAPIEHKEFLAECDDNNFIRHFAESLVKNLPEDGSVIVYNKSFESARNKELGEMYPDLKEEMERINNNIVDFMVPFQKRQYCTKQMKGSYSLKNVLPALYPDDPELDYTKLSGVHDGEEARKAFTELKEESQEKQEKTREDLLKYCHLDSLAMVKIYEKFRETIEE